jgi:hypothetical protein
LPNTIPLSARELFVGACTPNLNDIWVATPDGGNDGSAEATLRFASVKDCTGEPTGVYFDERNHFAEGGPVLYVNLMRAAGRPDLALAVMEI